MGRKSRIHYFRATYHVILRGNNRQLIFTSDNEYQKFLDLLYEAIERFDFSIHSYCLMPNHLHLILEVRNINLSRIMHNIAYRYSRWFNAAHNKVGHLFQDRYKALLVHDEQHFLDLCRYIHLNPVKAKLAKSPEEYRWSSHLSFLQQKQGELVTIDLMFSILNKLTNNRQAYQELIRNGLENTNLFTNLEPDLFSYENDDYFVSSLVQNSRAEIANSIALEKIIDTVCTKLKISKHLLSCSSKNRKIGKARAFITLLNVEQGVNNNRHLAKIFNRHPTAISNLAIRYQRNMLLDCSLRKEFEIIKSSLKQ